MLKPLIPVLTALSLTACAGKDVKPWPVPVPRVDCEQAPGPDIPDWPEDWGKDGPVFAITILGALTDERLARQSEHDCVKQLKTLGVIR